MVVVTGKFRILGEHIYEQWEFDKMFQQVKFELGRLKLSEERRLRKSAARATKVTNAILLLMAFRHEFQKMPLLLKNFFSFVFA